MSGGIASEFPQSHRFWSPQQTQPLHTLSPVNSSMSGKKRKAEDEPERQDDRMSASPTPAPAPAPRTASGRQIKRPRTNTASRALSLPRLLETLSADEMRGVIRSICDRHPDIGAEIVATAPRPSVASALSVLSSYESSLRESFPYGDRPSSEYSYNRVRQSLMNLLDALKDYTPHFLPPHEPQPATSLAFLDGATNVVHRLPNWESYQHDRHKHDAYEETSRAWAVVIREAAKKGGGIQIQYGGWDQKLAKHNEISGGRMHEAMQELRTSIGWMDGEAGGSQDGGARPQDAMSIREQLLSGTYGTNPPAIQVGDW